MRTATDIRNDMEQLYTRKVELLKERKTLGRDTVEYYMIELELSDIRCNLELLRDEFKAQVDWDNQNIFDRN